jgi:NADH dehydrogenase
VDVLAAGLGFFPGEAASVSETSRFVSFRLFVTGGTGFVGRHLLPRLPFDLFQQVSCLTRSPERLAAHGRVTAVPGDLANAASYSQALASSDTVVHLAASVGKASAVEHLRTNLEGTRRLLEECRRLGVERFVYVSSVAAKFKDISDYPYARSKREAEAAVRESGLTYCIVRPTLVVGRGGRAWSSLQALARRAVIPLPGSGASLTQPVYVEDLAECLVSVLRNGRFWNEAFDVGGPERITVEALVQAIHRHHSGKSGHVIHVPLGPILSVMRRGGGTSGRLRFFLEDGVAEPNPLLERHRPTMRGMEDMIALSIERR